jgi:hypothetical protein
MPVRPRMGGTQAKACGYTEGEAAGLSPGIS